MVANDPQKIAPRGWAVADPEIVTVDSPQQNYFVDDLESKTRGLGSTAPVEDSRVRHIGAEFANAQGGCSFDQAVSYTHLTLPTILLV